MEPRKWNSLVSSHILLEKRIPKLSKSDIRIISKPFFTRSINPGTIFHGSIIIIIIIYIYIYRYRLKKLYYVVHILRYICKYIYSVYSATLFPFDFSSACRFSMENGIWKRHFSCHFPHFFHSIFRRRVDFP